MDPHITKMIETSGEIIYLFPALYKIDSQKRERIWKLSVADTPIPEIRILHGLTEGKLADKITPISNGKGKNNVFEQALSEAKSKYNAKINREGYQEDKPQEGEDNFIPRPMLAKTFSFDSLSKKSGNIVLPAYIQPKLDGIRCFAKVKTGDLKSRQMKPFETLSHISQEVKKLGQMMGKDGEEIWLDGEIYHHEIEFGVIQGICNSITSSKNLTPEKLAIAGELQYFIYDIYDHKNPDTGYQNRFQNLQKILSGSATKFKHLILLETHMVSSPQEIKDYHQNFVGQKYEGVILRNITGPYEPNKRSQHLQKYKSFLDEEFPIIDFKAADNDYWIDDKVQYPVVTWVCKATNGKEFSVKFKAPKKVQHQYFLDGKKYIGSLLTVIFQEYTPDGVPRFPVGKEIRKFI